MSSTHKAYFELLLASVLWGFGFIATIYALPGIGPIWMTSVRFLIAIVMLDLLFRTRIFGTKAFTYSWGELKSLFVPGFFLFALLGLQTAGLKYTSPTRSGFITVLYVLFIPFFERFAFKLPIRRILFLWIGLAIVGTALICKAVTSDGLSGEFLGSFNFGDFLTLLCALAQAAHFIVVKRSLGKVESPVKFHLYQSFWVMVIAAVFGSFMEGFGWLHSLTSGQWTPLVWFGVLHLGILSSGVAFLIQVRAQRYVNPSTVGIIVLMESPWAMAFSVALFHEPLTGLQITGAALILTAAVAESLSQIVLENRRLKQSAS